jgi:hypothetical protein
MLVSGCVRQHRLDRGQLRVPAHPVRVRMGIMGPGHTETRAGNPQTAQGLFPLSRAGHHQRLPAAPACERAQQARHLVCLVARHVVHPLLDALDHFERAAGTQSAAKAWPHRPVVASSLITRVVWAEYPEISQRPTIG